MATISRILRSFLKNVHLQKRFYADAPPNENQMKLTFAGANKVFYDNVIVKQVDVPSFSGSFGVLPKHVPCLAVLKPGVVTVFEEKGDVKKIFVSSGTITINQDSTIQVLAEEAHPIEALDKSACRDLLNKAQDQLSRASSEKDKAEAEIALEVTKALEQAAL
ncbi:PREDICTED: ATP synthase subunit delta, mitochondrial [Ceratosolen solmsi marchali]|uniref:F-ATPase delta subunit n=1 Tax=Ceratosolen solmsi marchali TaxID=326594 RepID=A0AAJ7E1B4_9HYME|nr:PREDICTED: ATP synthase subunit delta, mitochondrial [Ceratosolen solmsi marchali]